MGHEVEEYNNKIIKSGAWINAEFLSSVLSDSLRLRVKVWDYKLKAAVGPGENYMSTVYRIFVTYSTGASPEQKHQFLIIKGSSLEGFLQGVAEEINMFQKEIAMYREVLPKMQLYSEESFGVDAEHVAPKGYNCSRHNTLIMEDISARGYKTANRIDQLDLEHTLAVLQAMARFHALSVKLHEKDPALVLSVAEELYQETGRTNTRNMVEGTISAMLSAMEKWPEAARFLPRIRELARNFWDKMVFVSSPFKSIKVLNHGDVWVNNILFQYDEDGNVKNVKFVDFQLCRYTTPASDLLYFLFSSTKAEIVANNFSELLLAYHTALLADIAKLGLRVKYTFVQLQQEMRHSAYIAISVLAIVLNVVLAPPALPNEMFIIKENDNVDPKMENYMNPAYRKAVCTHLDLLDRMGYLDAAIDLLRPLSDEQLPMNTTVRVQDADETRTEELSLVDRIVRILKQPICE